MSAQSAAPVQLVEPAQCKPVFPKILDLKSELLTSLQQLKEWKIQSDRMDVTARLKITEGEISIIKQFFDNTQRKLLELQNSQHSQTKEEKCDLVNLETALVQLECDYNNLLLEYSAFQHLRLEVPVDVPDLKVTRQKVKSCLFALINQALREMSGLVELWTHESFFMTKCKVYVQIDRTLHSLSYVTERRRGRINLLTNIDRLEDQYLNYLPTQLKGFSEQETTNLYCDVFNVCCDQSAPMRVFKTN